MWVDQGLIFDHSMLGLLITLAGGSEHAFWSFYARVFHHSMLGLLIILAGGLEHAFWSFYARAFDNFGGWIGACFLVILC